MSPFIRVMRLTLKHHCVAMNMIYRHVIKEHKMSNIIAYDLGTGGAKASLI